MLAAALIPLMFAIGLLFLFVFGAWPAGPGTLVAFALVVATGIMLVRYLREPRSAES